MALRPFVSTRKPDLTGAYFVSSFINGLKEEINGSMQVFEPPSIDQALCLTLLKEVLLDIISLQARGPGFTFLFFDIYL